MKSKIFSLLAFIALTMLFYNCTSSDLPEESSIVFKSAIENEIIGYIDENNNFIIYPEKLKSIKERIEQIISTEIHDLKIEEAYTIANPETGAPGGELYYVIRGKSVDETQNVAMHILRLNNNFQAYPPGTKVISCRSQCGCKPQSYTDEGTKYWKCTPYCISCTKTETVY